MARSIAASHAVSAAHLAYAPSSATRTITHDAALSIVSKRDGTKESIIASP